MKISTRCAALKPEAYTERVQASIAQHVQAILEMQRRGADRLRLWQQSADAGEDWPASIDAFSYPGFVPAFIRDSFCEGRGPFRWVALSGDPADIAKTDAAMLKLFPEDKRLQRMAYLRRQANRFSGTAGAHLLAGLP